MADSFLITVLILISALLCSKLLPIPVIYHPLSFVAAFCTALAHKVHPDPARPITQQRLSGALALLVVVSIPVILLNTSYLFASWAYLIDAIVLIACFNWQPYVQQAVKVTLSLEKHLISLARTQSRLLLLRDTKPLNQLGLVKALLESLALRFSQQIIALTFWYLLAGATGALAYRLCQIASQQWSVKITHFKHFGYVAARVHLLLCIIPYVMSALLLWLQRGNKSLKPRCVSAESELPKVKTILLQQLSRTLQVSLGGPAYYRKQLFRRVRLQQNLEPDIGDIKRLLRLQQHQFTLLLLLLLGLAGLQLIP